MSYKLIVKWQNCEKNASTICRFSDEVRDDVENFLTGEFASPEPGDTVERILIRRLTAQEESELAEGIAQGAFGRDVVEDGEAI